MWASETFTVLLEDNPILCTKPQTHRYFSSDPFHSLRFRSPAKQFAATRRPAKGRCSMTIPASCPRWKRPAPDSGVAVSNVRRCRWFGRRRKRWSDLSVRIVGFLPRDRRRCALLGRTTDVRFCVCAWLFCRPAGLVFLQYRTETKRALLPNEITSIDTVRALFVRSFPRQLTMAYLEGPNVKIYIHDASKDMFYELEDVR